MNFWLKFWHRHSILWPRFPYREWYFGDLRTFSVDFNLHWISWKSVIFLLPVYFTYWSRKCVTCCKYDKISRLCLCHFQNVNNISLVNNLANAHISRTSAHNFLSYSASRQTDKRRWKHYCTPTCGRGHNLPPFSSPAHVVQWSNHLGAMCSRAWRSQWPRIDSILGPGAYAY